MRAKEVVRGSQRMIYFDELIEEICKWIDNIKQEKLMGNKANLFSIYAFRSIRANKFVVDLVNPSCLLVVSGRPGT